MRDVKGFCKLFDISIPNEQYFDYYIEQLSKTSKLQNIYDLISLYEDFEKDCTDVLAHKIKKSQEVVQYILNSYAYQELTCHPIIDYPINKNFVYEEDKIYVSIDIIKANFASFKSFDDKNEFGDSYADFLLRFDIHPVFTHSKNFRQYIFGNTNPKRQSKMQRSIIEKLLNQLAPLNLETACVRADEVIYSIKDFSELQPIIDVIDQDKFKIQIFKVQRIDDFRINTYYSTDGTELNSELIGCDGNKYFMFLKQYILKQPLDIKDLYFRYASNSMAIWNVEGLKLSL